jgi:hypothetical protein
MLSLVVRKETAQLYKVNLYLYFWSPLRGYIENSMCNRDIAFRLNIRFIYQLSHPFIHLVFSPTTSPKPLPKRAV